MEHRCSARVPTTNKVTIYQHKIPVAVCHTSDIGMGGMFVKIGGITYPNYTKLELEFELATESGVKLFRMTVCVVYGAEQGLGLMFLNSNSELSGTIRKMIKSNTNRIEAQQLDDLEPIPVMA